MPPVGNPRRPQGPFGWLFRGPAVYLLVLFLLVWVFLSYFGPSPNVKDLRLDQFDKAVRDGQVKNAVLYDKDNRIEGELSNGTKYRVSICTECGDDVVKTIQDRDDVSFTVKSGGQSALVQFLLQLLPFLLIFGLFFFLMNQMQGGGNRVMSFGKSRARLVTKDMPKVTFKDVAGVDEAIEELTEIKEFLENPAKFQAMGAKIPKGVLLFGPPGSGKTLLARAVAGEAGVPFYSISGSDFVEMFVGVGAARVRDLFEQAKQNAPAIVFVDEIDASAASAAPASAVVTTSASKR